MRKIAVLFILIIFFVATVAPAGAQAGWMVVAWAGDSGDLPEGWQVCDGTNGTPDLQNAFLVGAGDEYALAETGGSASVNLNHQHTVDAHSHTISTADLSHTHSVPSHSHTISTADLSHTHSVPSHSHTIADSGALPHSHGLPFHQHSIGAADLAHSHAMVKDGAEGGSAFAHQVGSTSSTYGGYMQAWVGGGGTTYYRTRDYTTSALTTHDHGGGTGYVYNTGTVTDGNVNHNHGGTTGNWNGTSGAMSANSTHNHGGTTGNWDGTSGAMSANGTHNHGGTTGSITTTTDYQLSDVSTLPPYYAVYYACAPASALSTPITATAMLTDPLTTDYYETTEGITYSRVRTVDTGTEITNYLLIAILALAALQIVLWFITEAKRKWN